MASSFSDLLFNGSPPPSVTTSSDSFSTMPAWYNSYLSSLANAATSVASQDYQAYPGQRIQQLDPQQEAAYGYLGQNATSWQQPLNTAINSASNVATGFDPSQFSQYMSPYVGGVVNEIGRLGQQNLTENLLPTLNSQFVGTGGFGSQRNMDTAEHLIRDTGANISGQQGMALQGAFTSAMDKYLQGQQVSNSAAQNLGGLSQTQGAMTTGTAGALSASGQTMQNVGQQNLNLGYQDWLNQLNYPRQNVSFLSSVLRGQQVPTGQDSVSTGPYQGTMSPSPLSTFAGLTLAGLGYNQPTQKARGGRVMPVRRPVNFRGGLNMAANDPMMMAERPRMGGLQLAA